MKKFLAIALSLGALTLTACSNESETQSTEQIVAASESISMFTQAKFEALQAEGKPILIDVYADWCPTCKKQSKVINEYLKTNPELNVLKVSFDNQKDVVKQFKAPRQSTLVLFKGEKNLGTLVAQTNADKLTEFFQQAK